jgi:glycosyltransferase involved in cell wall biosynthesis
MPLTYKSENHEYISSLVRRFAFDSPKSSIFYPENSFFLVAGWCVPANPSDKISVFVEYSNKPVEKFDLSVHRADVVSSLKIDMKSFSHKNFGFEIKIDTKNLKSIGFIINSDISIEIWTYTDANRSLDGNGRQENQLQHIEIDISEKIPEEFLKIFSHQADQLNTNTLDNILAAGEGYFSKIKIKTIKINEIDYFFDEETSALARLIHAETSRNEWNTEAIKRLHQGGPVFNFSKKAKTYNNFIVDDISYLLLAIENCFFYLVQYCGNIGIFFPKNQTFFSFTPIESWVSICIEKLKTIFHLTLKKFVFNNYALAECKFSGAVLAQTRPYHFFYDGLYCLAHLALDDSIKTPIHVKSIQEKCFLDPSMIFSTNEFTFDTLNACSFNKQQSELKNEFYILACNQYYQSRSAEIINYLDEKIIDSSRHSKLKNSKPLESIFLKSNFVLWIGISSEKRKVDNLLNKLKILIESIKNEKGIRLTICFDGRTFPLIPSEQDRLFANSEANLIRDIQKDFPENTVFLNLAGAHSIDKLFIANKVDYFFCSFATDSLYVSRICKKEGFAYYPANAEAALGMHIHPNAELVKCATHQESIGASWHTSDSIIDWDLLSLRIKGHLLNKGVNFE